MLKNDNFINPDKTLVVAVNAFFETLDECVEDKSKQQLFYQVFIRNIIKRNHEEQNELVFPFDKQMVGFAGHQGASN